MAELLLIITAWIHVLFAIAVIGGGFFNLYVLGPQLKLLQPSDAAKITMAVGKSFIVLVWTSIAGLFVTGIIRSAYVGFSKAFGFGDSYGITMNIKLILFAVIIINAFLITKTARKIQSTPPQERQPLGKKIRTLSTANAPLGIAIVLLAVILRYNGL